MAKALARGKRTVRECRERCSPISRAVRPDIDGIGGGFGFRRYRSRWMAIMESSVSVSPDEGTVFGPAKPRAKPDAGASAGEGTALTFGNRRGSIGRQAPVGRFAGRRDHVPVGMGSAAMSAPFALQLCRAKGANAGARVRFAHRIALEIVRQTRRTRAESRNSRNNRQVERKVQNNRAKCGESTANCLCTYSFSTV